MITAQITLVEAAYWGLAFAARNLGLLWTEYSGVDPESFGTTGDAPSSFQAFGSPTYYTFRLTLGF